MSIVKVALAVFCFASVANALVTVPGEGLRPPKRPPAPAPPTLAPFPYASAHSRVPGPLVIVPDQPETVRSRPVESFFNTPIRPETVRSRPVESFFNTPIRPETGRSRPVQSFFNSPLSQPTDSSPVFRDEVRDKNGQFQIRHSDGKGTLVDESGRLLSTDDGWEYVIVKEGAYSFTSPEGSPISVKYVADENGVKSSYSIRSQ